ncbi:hypothetical protein C8Z91_14190 [Paenibacillus elgii]|uniref:Pentapeptide repeat-containing protein n=1 Tax=Paenibacillus elgii TaxID=189691 RepID=A0A2T6G3L3_9BACL|nr:hypothetical protein C8Z91_14190 [Paenibacillus elgii]
MFIEEEYYDEHFVEAQYSQKEVTSVRFYDCTFTKCDFSETVFKDCKFSGCTFENCNLSLIQVLDCDFSQVSFTHSKLIGINWAAPKSRVRSAAVRRMYPKSFHFHRIDAAEERNHKMHGKERRFQGIRPYGSGHELYGFLRKSV